MNEKRLLIALISTLLVCGALIAASAQSFPDGNVVFLTGTSDPAGTCVIGTEYYRTDNSARFTCVNGTWSAYGATFPLLSTVTTCTLPGYSFAADTDTGVCRPSSGTVALAANGDPILSAAGGVSNIAYVSVLATDFATLDLGTPANGSYSYCSDCVQTNPCAGSGTGAFAVKLNGVWQCGAGT